MNPATRITIAATALLAAAFVQAQPVAPPVDGIDLGALKAKPKTVTTTPASPVGTAPAAPAGVARPVIGAVPTPGRVQPVNQITPATPTSPAQATQTTQTNQAQTNQTGIGNVVSTPLGKKSAAEILGQSSPAKVDDKPQSSDVQVKLPSMLRRQ